MCTLDALTSFLIHSVMAQESRKNAESYDATKRTPFKISSSIQTGITQPDQEEMQELLAAELDGAYWISTQILDVLFPVDDDICNAVYESKDLKKTFQVRPGGAPLVLQTALGDEGGQKRRAVNAGPSSDTPLQEWPSHQRSERDHYGPLMTLINCILAAADRESKRRKKEAKHFDTLVCSIYDKEISSLGKGKASSGSKNPLKPDLILSELAVSKERRCRWSDLDAFVEVKKIWPALFSQAATYARCMLAEANPKTGYHQRFTLGILFNQKDFKVTLAVFHRAGCTRTPEVSINTATGLRRLVRILVGIKLVSGPEGAGFDVSGDQHSLLRKYPYSKTLFYRSCILGRATSAEERSADPYPEEEKEEMHELTEALTGEFLSFTDGRCANVFLGTTLEAPVLRRSVRSQKKRTDEGTHNESLPPTVL